MIDISQRCRVQTSSLHPDEASRKEKKLTVIIRVFEGGDGCTSGGRSEISSVSDVLV